MITIDETEINAIATLAGTLRELMDMPVNISANPLDCKTVRETFFVPRLRDIDDALATINQLIERVYAAAVR
jgi:hypothetical protein